jgi:1-acylglycerone phosphate reductase
MTCSPTPWNGLYSATKAAFHALSEVLAMECRPFNVDVMLVAPGAVRSNIAKNQAASFSLQADSLYGDFLENIIGRMNASQSSRSMATDEFAKRVVTKALAKSPPTYMLLGGFTIGVAIFKWMPRSWVLSTIWKYFSRKK